MNDNEQPSPDVAALRERQRRAMEECLQLGERLKVVIDRLIDGVLKENDDGHEER